jgi:glycosyltransferase involved in cell wall biosynthesis
VKIAYIGAGAAGMYCGTCLHDNTLAAALKDLGHDITLIPTYTPLRTDEEDVSIGRVFYGAINVYLQQSASLFRHMPRVADALLDRPWLLDLASRSARSTDPGDLGAMTLSVLEGEEGNQSRELHKLLEFLGQLRPEIVHLTNSMFLGLAGPIRRELGIPVLCAVQGEDLFLEGLREPFRSQVHSRLRDRARDADAFLAACRYYADHMAELLDVPRAKMHVVPLGLNLEGHGTTPVREASRTFTVGYLARIAPEKGLHVLARAFRELAESAGPESVRLRAAGWLGARDGDYLEGVRRDLESWGVSHRFQYVGEVDREEKIHFLSSLDVLSVPTTYEEPKGMFVLEALANGVPVVQPRHGAFPELVAWTGGGVLVEPDSPAALAQALGELREDPERRWELGLQGKKVVHARFGHRPMAEKTLALYDSVLAESTRR